MIADMFDDPTFDHARQEATAYVSMPIRMGESEPVRLGPEEMDCPSLQQVLETLKGQSKQA